MATIKSYTDLGQSKVLAEILPHESADVWWVALNWQETEYYVEIKQDGINQPKKAIPCWSLAALLGVLPKIHKLKPILDLEECSILYSGTDIYVTASNLIDACVEMIEKLHEQKLL